MGFMKEKNF